MATKKLGTQIRQEQIAQATLDLIAAKGLANVSVAAVARRVGVVPSALYRHFAGKDEVLDAAVEMILNRLQANVDAVVAEEAPPLEQLRRLLEMHADMVCKNRGIPLILLSQDFYFARADRRQRVHRGMRAYLSRVANLIRRAQQLGHAAPAVNADVASVMFLGLIQTPGIMQHMSDGQFDVRSQVAQAWPLFEGALRIV